jgi:flagellar biogenesis protein FliO
MIDNNLMNAFLSMGAIVVLLLVILFVLKRIARKKQSGGASYDMKIVSRLPLQQKAQLLIVEAQGKNLLIGLTDQNVNLIANLSEDNDLISKNDSIEKIFPSSNSRMQETIKNAAKSSENLNNDLSFKAFLKSTFMNK